MVNDIVFPSVKLVQQKDNFGSFEIAPLHSWLSTELANSLRRVLLSSLPGAAITSVRIEGVQHEFQDILHVREDVTDIVQNLKKVRLCSYADHDVHVELNVQGECLATAGDIIAPSTIEIVNPGQHIATLDNDQAHLHMHLVVGTGRGFVSAEVQSQVIEEQAIGVILIDAIYSPITHVNFTIEHMQQGMDQVLLGITTDGTILPEGALRQGSDILCKQFMVFKDYWRKNDVDGGDDLTVLSDVPIPRYIYNIALEDIDLSPRAYNIFRRYNVTKVGQLLVMNDEDILAMRNMGVRTLQEVYECLLKKGLFPKKEK